MRAPGFVMQNKYNHFANKRVGRKKQEKGEGRPIHDARRECEVNNRGGSCILMQSAVPPGALRSLVNSFARVRLDTSARGQNL